MIIRVAESYEVRLPPERGTVMLRVSLEGSDKASVTAEVTAALTDLTARVQRLLDPSAGPIITFDQGQLQTTAQRPWNQDGKLLPFIYRTTGTLNAQFNDFAALFAFIEEVAILPGVEIQGVRWELTKATEQHASAGAEAEVVHRLTEKARRYAMAAGATRVVPTIIADPGLLLGSGGGAPGGIVPLGMAKATFASPEAGGFRGSGLEFQPDDIVLTASAQAEFEAN